MAASIAAASSSVSVSDNYEFVEMSHEAYNTIDAIENLPEGTGQVFAITAEVADFLLMYNDSNYRNLSKTHLANLKAVMREDRYMPHASTIMIEEDMTLADGQHRLTAVAETGCTAHMFIRKVVNGTHRLAEVDTGKGRTVVDYLNQQLDAEDKKVRAMGNKIVQLLLLKYGSRKSNPSEQKQKVLEVYQAIQPSFVWLEDVLKKTPHLNIAPQVVALWYLGAMIDDQKEAAKWLYYIQHQGVAPHNLLKWIDTETQNRAPGNKESKVYALKLLNSCWKARKQDIRRRNPSTLNDTDRGAQVIEGLGPRQEVQRPTEAQKGTHQADASHCPEFFHIQLCVVLVHVVVAVFFV